MINPVANPKREMMTINKYQTMKIHLIQEEFPSMSHLGVMIMPNNKSNHQQLK
jgi:hypothetical protein